MGVVLLPNPSPSASVPVAYLRMVFYNAQNTIIQQSVRYVGGQNNFWQYYETGNTEALQNGRVEIYVANESVPNVWFDNLAITHLPTLISQENHYYAFGMNAKEVEKEGKPNDRFQFMGVEKESSFALDWTETDHRSYDSEVGRFWQVDKLSEEAFNWTSYRYGFNNPISHTDPTGLWEQKADRWSTNNPDEIKAFINQSRGIGRSAVEDRHRDENNHFDDQQHIGKSTELDRKEQNNSVSVCPWCWVGRGLVVVGVAVGKWIWKNGKRIFSKKVIKNEAFEEAQKNGGRHHGLYKQYLDKPKEQIEKGIKSYQKTIEEHLELIKNPKETMKKFDKGDWDLLDPREQKALIEKKWPSDVKRLKEQRDILKGILESK
ncbi:MAG: hypothetical protein EAZ06_10170 [Cytophagales bacterium]|nr:MAG: hypothetical protein EAZ06_10170 [Cytophagales bacterium]